MHNALCETYQDITMSGSLDHRIIKKWFRFELRKKNVNNWGGTNAIYSINNGKSKYNKTAQITLLKI